MQSQGSTAVPFHGDESAGTAYNQRMQPSPALVQIAVDRSAKGADSDRTAAVVTVVGAAMLLLASILPWGEMAVFGFSLTTAHGENARILLGVLGVASGSAAAAVLFRRTYGTGVAIVLIGLAAAQVGASMWFGVVVVSDIRHTHPELVFFTAVGTGVYIAGLGSACTLIGAALAWTRRRTG